MSENAVLLTSLSSFALGVAAEPIKTAIVAFFNAKRLRRALYMELAALHRRLDRATCECGEKPADLLLDLNVRRLRSLTFDMYKNAKSTKPEFYALPDAVRFDEIFGTYEYTVKSPPDILAENESVMESAKACLYFIDKYLQDGRLNDDIFREVYPEYTEYLDKKQVEAAAGVASTAG